MVDIQTNTEGETHKITVKGEIDASSSIELDNALKHAADNYKRILMDLNELEYISSAGLGVFISYLEELEKEGVSLVIYGLQIKVREVFEILGLQHLMNIAVTEEEAYKSLNEG